MRRLFGAPNGLLRYPGTSRRPTGGATGGSRQAVRLPGPGPVVLVLPARDEAATVAAVIARTPSRVAERDVVVVVVDDGSSDDTARQARSAGADVVSLSPGRGLGAAVRVGLGRAVDHHRAVAVAFCDADGEYSPEQLPELVEPILAGRADYVVGSRFTGTIESMQRRRRLGNRLLTAVLRRMAGVPLTDGQSGYRALSRRAATEAEIIHDYNYAQVLTLDLLAKGFAYEEVPIRYRFRTTGKSFVSLPRYLARVVPAVVRELRSASTTMTPAETDRTNADARTPTARKMETAR